MFGWCGIAGADLDAKDYQRHTPLHVAAILGSLRAMRALLESGTHASGFAGITVLVKPGTDVDIIVIELAEIRTNLCNLSDSINWIPLNVLDEMNGVYLRAKLERAESEQTTHSRR